MDYFCSAAACNGGTEFIPLGGARIRATATLCWLTRTGRHSFVCGKNIEVLVLTYIAKIPIAMSNCNLFCKKKITSNKVD